MSSIDIKEENANICRICLSEDSENIHTIYDELQKDAMHIHEFLMSFTDIKVEKFDGLPCYICNNCLGLTLSAFNLYKLCNKSQEHFNKILNIEETELNSDIETKFEVHDETLMVTVEEAVAVKNEPETSSATHDGLETNPNVKRNFDYTGVYVERVNDKGLRQYECIECKKLIASRIHDFRRHYDLHLEPFYRCKYCNCKFHRQYLYKSHLALAHNEPSATPDDQAKSKKTAVVSTESIKPEVQETNPDVKKIAIHEGSYTIKIVDNQRNFVCDECGKSYIELPDLKKHLEEHLGDIYKCTHCQKAFNSQKTYKTHLLTHSVERHMCDKCGKTYKTKSGLHEHNNVHNNIKYKCDMCDKSYFQKGELHMHKRCHSNYRPFICRFCAASFKRSSHLSCHEQGHLGKKYKCEQCDRGFTLQQSYKRHKITHMVNPPLIHSCDQCDKSFKTKGNLRQHQQSHMERRFQCDFCLKKFTQAHSLRSHKKICSGPAE